MDTYARRYDTEPSSFAFTFMMSVSVHDTPQSKGMIDCDTITVELLITGDANCLAHLAVDEAKRQLIDTADQYKSVSDAIIKALYSRLHQHKSSLLVTSCVGRRDLS